MQLPSDALPPRIYAETTDAAKELIDKIADLSRLNKCIGTIKTLLDDHHVPSPTIKRLITETLQEHDVPKVGTEEEKQEIKAATNEPFSLEELVNGDGDPDAAFLAKSDELRIQSRYRTAALEQAHRSFLDTDPSDLQLQEAERWIRAGVATERSRTDILWHNSLIDAMTEGGIAGKAALRLWDNKDDVLAKLIDEGKTN
ncbi:MAG TPA: hypothetical protein VE090_03565 [Methylomirabilota bacterium]|nr:hypothetical protein [Methylomirabilota bacterium]